MPRKGTVIVDVVNMPFDTEIPVLVGHGES